LLASIVPSARAVKAREVTASMRRKQDIIVLKKHEDLCGENRSERQLEFLGERGSSAEGVRVMKCFIYMRFMANPTIFTMQYVVFCTPPNNVLR
jgi:hypothetical protein